MSTDKKTASCEVTLRCTEEARPNEVRDLIISALSAYLANQPDGYSRCRTVCEALLNMNAKSNYEEKLEKGITNALRSKDAVREFERLGFSHKRDRKHHILKWGDQTVILPSSPSDHRSAKNVESDIKKKILVCK